jgi:TPR repeat protein
LYGAAYGVEQDYALSASWLRKAALQGVAYAQLILSSYYYEGIGVTQDEVEAYAYLKIAAATNVEAREYLAQLDKKISPDNRLRGLERAKELLNEIAARTAAKKVGR